MQTPAIIWLSLATMAVFVAYIDHGKQMSLYKHDSTPTIFGWVITALLLWWGGFFAAPSAGVNAEAPQRLRSPDREDGFNHIESERHSFLFRPRLHALPDGVVLRQINELMASPGEAGNREERARPFHRMSFEQPKRIHHDHVLSDGASVIVRIIERLDYGPRFSTLNVSENPAHQFHVAFHT